MNLEQLLEQLQPTTLSDIELPQYLMGSFRRKSITFFNGMTDEKTIVYWFQSKSFSIDLRLVDGNNTSIYQRQGWIGDTIWGAKTELLSWHIKHNYQNYVQWPEPAKLYQIGNSILEFSPSNAYVEDWRQQAKKGLFLGLRLFQMQHLASQEIITMDGGLIITDQHIAYAQSRLPYNQQQIGNVASLYDLQDKNSSIENYEVSIALNDATIHFSTQPDKINQLIALDHFEIMDSNTISQLKVIDGEEYQLYFDIDIYQPHFEFSHSSSTTSASKQWFDQEKDHLLKNSIHVL